jgi:predicted permease
VSENLPLEGVDTMRIHRWIVLLASWLVPGALRAEWRAEWHGELDHRETARAQWARRHLHFRLDLIRPSVGAFWDALWLQSSRWYSLRLFGRHWRMAFAAILSLSVAIAATVIGFASYNALLLRPPGVGDPSSLLLIHAQNDAETFGSMSYAEYDDYGNRTQAFAEIAAFPYGISSITFKAVGRSEQVVATQVSNNFFRVLGVAPRLGVLTFRGSPPEGVDDIVVSAAFWRKLGSDPGIVGTSASLNDQRVTIVGVAPATFGGMTLVWEPQIWMSLKAAERILGSSPNVLSDRTQRWLHPIGRLKPGVTRAQALADVKRVASQIERDHPGLEKSRSATLTTVTVTPAGDRSWVSMIVGGLVLIVLLTLIVACANVTNLLLGLSTSRRHEMLVRAALGASRVQLVVPLLRESLVLGLVAAAIGYGAGSAILAKAPAFTPSLGGFWPAPSMDFRPDALVFAATLIVAIVAGIGVGLPPALRAASDGLAGSINRELSAGEPRKARVRQVLVVIQMAVATVVLVGVGVSIRSFITLQQVPLGFSARHLMFAGVDLRRSGFDARTGPAFYDRMRQRVAGMPGVEAATVADDPPLAGFPNDHVATEGEPTPPDGHGAETPYSVVDASYFSTLGIDVLQGRTFDSRDRPGGPEVVVINATMARQRWPGLDSIGQGLRIENGNRLVHVIGVVADGKYEDVTESQLPFMYFALAQHYLPDITVIARPRGQAVLPPDTITRALIDMHPAIVLGGIGAMTLDDLLGLSLLLPRTIVAINLIFGILTLALAVLGLYSTVFYSVSQRTKEMGIRTALGAQPRDIFTLVLRQTGWVALAGAACGVAAGMALLPLASSIFYGIGPVEPVVIGVVALTSVMVAVATTYAVARQWMGLSSIEMLRQ